MSSPNPDHLSIDNSESDYDDSRSEISNLSLATSSAGTHYENGRMYSTARNSEYWGPVDKLMMEHENYVHHMCLSTLRGELYLAPINHPNRILDVGTGTALWAIDMAEKFLNSHVLAIDTAQQSFSLPPTNFTFEIDDASASWEYSEPFDFVHIRGLFGSIADWPELYAQAYENITPGGYIEQMEWSVRPRSIDGPFSEDSAFARWWRYCKMIEASSPRTFMVAERMEGWIRDAGFVDVQQHTFKWPIGTWPKDEKKKDLGRRNRKNWEDGMGGWALRLFTDILGWTSDECELFFEEVKKALYDRSQHAYTELRVVYGRKPDRSDEGG